MHNAPSVIYPVGRCRWVAVLQCLLAALALLTLVMWWVMVSKFSTQRWVGWAGAVLWLWWVIWAVRGWRRSSQGWLEWDARAHAASLDPSEGQGRGAWRWRDSSQQVSTRLKQVELAVDLQMLALLRLRGTGQHPGWAWLERRRAPARWNDLRRALHSPDV